MYIKSVVCVCLLSIGFSSFSLYFQKYWVSNNSILLPTDIISSGSRGIDIGSGYGVITARLARQSQVAGGYFAFVEPLDEQYAATIKEIGLTAHYESYKMTVEKLAQHTDQVGRYDWATVYKIQIGPNMADDFFKAIAAILRPGGKLYMTTADMTEQFKFTPNHRTSLLPFIEKYFVIDRNEIAEGAYRYILVHSKGISRL